MANRLMQKLGPIFTTMPVTRPPVAILYSLSQAIRAQTADRTNANYAHAYCAIRVGFRGLQHQFCPSPQKRAATT